MLISEENILELIPQRSPMVMIDSLVSCDEKQAVSRLTIREDNIFMNSNGFTASGLMEAMAQTAAARTGYLLKNHPESANKNVPVGVIGSIKNFRLFFQPQIDSILNITVEIAHEVLMATVVKGKVEVDGKMAAEAELQIYITEPNFDKP
jgi:3-hydroxymyristoyl/3-hydroxydecanoyl-(acyl carrier protein) dehydratase